MSQSSSSSSSLAVKDVVHKLQLCLLEGIDSEEKLLAAGSLLSKSDYQDVVTERLIAQMCGYPLCPNSLPSLSDHQKKGRYRISLKEHKVYDLSETHMYCSTKCVVDSRAYAGSLQEERCSALDTGKIDKVMSLFDSLNLYAEEGTGKNGELEFSKLTIKEKDGIVGEGVVSMEEWIGPSNAIEGYIPQHDRDSKNHTPGTKLNNSKPKKGAESIFEEINFMSTIITQDNGYSISKEPFGQTKNTPSTKSRSSKKKMNRKGTDDSSTVSAAPSDNAQTQPGAKLTGLSKEETGDVTNCTLKNQKVSSSTCQSGTDKIAMENVRESFGGKEAQPGSSVLKSSLRSSGATKTHRSVTWADEKSDGANYQTLCEFNEVEHEKVTTEGTVITDRSTEDAFRFASAEACAEALSQAAEAVASGESDVPDAVSEAGLLILPPPLEDNQVMSKEDSVAVDPEPVSIKWPQKTGIVESDFLDSEDSWFDSPPEGFSLDLSTFATMFNALFAWISSSSLAYIYGHDDGLHEEYASINGREYPRKITLGDGRSSEIRQTLAGCLARALPGLVYDLRLPIPISTIEYGMGCLLDTMSFLDPLPALRMKQWQVLALLFIDALSVCRTPALAPHMTNRRFFQKVFDDGGISVEEYELLKDLIIPLGRAPQIATQSGG